MAKRARKTKKTQEEIDAIEADRMAAHEMPAEPVKLELVERDPVELVEDRADLESAMEGDVQPEEADLVIPDEDEEKPITSVVAEKFKLKYIQNAKESGYTGKAAKRSNWDWLAQEIAAECLKEKEKIDIAEFQDLLELNGVDYSRWTNRNKGWEGRFRMTGRVALQKVVANNGRLVKKMSESVPPPNWIEKFKTKA